jgi:hypothetical protein
VQRTVAPVCALAIVRVVGAVKVSGVEAPCVVGGLVV